MHSATPGGENHHLPPFSCTTEMVLSARRLLYVFIPPFTPGIWRGSSSCPPRSPGSSFAREKGSQVDSIGGGFLRLLLSPSLPDNRIARVHRNCTTRDCPALVEHANNARCFTNLTRKRSASSLRAKLPINWLRKVRKLREGSLASPVQDLWSSERVLKIEEGSATS